MKTQNDPIPSVNTDIQEQEILNEELNPVEQAMAYDSGPDSRSERLSNNAVKGAAWLLGIVAVFAVCILVAWMCNINESPMSSRLASSEAALKTPVNVAKSSLKSISSAVKQPISSLQGAVSKISGSTFGAVETATAKVESGVSSAVTSTQSDKDRIEKEALEVIHGDYGNNPGRAEKLGADYAQVQARVNQLMHI